MKNIFLIIVLIFLIMGNNSAQKKENDSIEKYFEGHAGCFESYHMQTGELFKYNKDRCAQRFLPASTFKIPNSLIGLETGVIADENFVIKWDSVDRQIKEWNRDQTLTTAIQFSVVPYYQELARRVGKKIMRQYLDKFNYGNRVMGNRVDTFWLDNYLKISADEQIEFLKKFYEYKLPVSKRSIDIVKKIMSQEKYDKSILKFKTGTGTKENGIFMAWLVGYVEKENKVFLFAFNIEAKTFDEAKRLRDTNSRSILKFLKVVE